MPCPALLRLCSFVLGMTPLAIAHADFYVGADIGLADSRTLDSRISGHSKPTRCDVLMYGDETRPSAAIGNDPACTDDSIKEKWNSRFDAGSGLAAGLHAGYARNRWRIELEFMHVEPGSASYPIVTASTHPGLASKDREWSETEPPYEWISDFRIRQYFANVFYDFATESRWTPYAGIGAGWARTKMQYKRRLLRKSIDEGYLDVAPDVPAAQSGYGWDDGSWREWRTNAAGTLSAMDIELSDTLFGFQLLAGIDYALTDRSSVGVKARWAQFDEFRDHTTYDRIRDHAPVDVDGITPFGDQVRMDNIEYWAVTVGFKHRF
ncbi:MAG: outer membrane beta-barrel protein [Gammaproteobacteria bacterium]|nr:outer membrane beta-barrel protein [Gammaproteobacteria bacterium]